MNATKKIRCGACEYFSDEDMYGRGWCTLLNYPTDCIAKPVNENLCTIDSGRLVSD